MTASLDHVTTRTRPPAGPRPLYAGARTRPGSRALAIGAAGGPLNTRTPVIHIATPQLQLSTKPSAVVLRIARLQGPIFRDDAASQSGLSVSTVNRQVTALLKAGLVRERADLAPAGAIGRPRLPFELNTTDFLTVGIHIGLKVTSITTHDLQHRVVGAIQIPTPVGDTAEQTLTAIGLSARRFASRWPSRRVLWTGVAIGGRVAEGGLVDHPRLGWTGAPVGPILSRTIGLPVSVASHVEAMAAAELLVNPETTSDGDRPGSFLYFYAREMVGIAFTVGGTVYTPTAGPPVIGHFPIGATTWLDPSGTGRLEPAVSDTGIVDAARAAGLSVAQIEDVHAAAASGDEVASAILLERAEVLGRTVSLIADMFNPDHVILGGQAFTDAPTTLPAVAKAVRSTPAAPDRDVRVSRAGASVQQQAAGAVSLDAVYSDPLAALALTA
ncbi:ROK family transcriptional regulator [Williamsia sp. SKLECPSW1]